MRRSESKPSASGSSEHPHRLPQLSSLLQHELGAVLARELELPPGVILTVTKVMVTDDLSLARIGVSVLPFASAREAFQALRTLRGELQRIMNERLKLYRVPKLDFYIDETPERAAAIEGLLDRLNDEFEVKPEDARRLDSLRDGG